MQCPSIHIFILHNHSLSICHIRLPHHFCLVYMKHTHTSFTHHLVVHVYALSSSRTRHTYHITICLCHRRMIIQYDYKQQYNNETMSLSWNWPEQIPNERLSFRQFHNQFPTGNIVENNDHIISAWFVHFQLIE